MEVRSLHEGVLLVQGFPRLPIRVYRGPLYHEVAVCFLSHYHLKEQSSTTEQSRAKRRDEIERERCVCVR